MTGSPFRGPNAIISAFEMELSVSTYPQRLGVRHIRRAFHSHPQKEKRSEDLYPAWLDRQPQNPGVESESARSIAEEEIPRAVVERRWDTATSVKASGGRRSRCEPLATDFAPLAPLNTFGSV
jgi:hypothetical protein